MFKWLVKKFVLGKINSALDANQNTVAATKATVIVWVARLEKILGCLKSLLAKLDDGKIDSEEVDQAVAEIQTVVKEW